MEETFWSRGDLYNAIQHTAQTQSLSRVQLFAAPWTVAHQPPLAMEFSRQEYWSGLPFPSLGDIPDPGIEPTCAAPPVLAGKFFTTTEPPGKSFDHWLHQKSKINLKN